MHHLVSPGRKIGRSIAQSDPLTNKHGSGRLESATRVSMLPNIDRRAPIEADHIASDLIRRGSEEGERRGLFRGRAWLNAHFEGSSVATAGL
jgi:hypothetical protein